MPNKNGGHETRSRVFEVIKEYINEHGYAPSYREIGDMAGLKSTSSVFTHVDKLICEGKLETDIEGGTVSPRAFRIGRKYEGI